jgi:hypothetical protein
MRLAMRSILCLTMCSALAGSGCAGGVPAGAPRAPASAAAEGVTEAQPQPQGDEAQPQPQGDPEVPPPRGYAEAAQGTSRPADPHRVRRIYGYAGIAIGGAAAVVAVVTSFMLLHQKSVLDDQCNAQKQCSTSGIGETGAIHNTIPVNTAAWIVAAVGLGAGTILLLTSQPESGKSTAVTVSPAPGGAALGLRSTF